MEKMITILGPTACGKTAVATQLAARFWQQGTGAEIISADSRQVFRGMDIGTGKDLADYDVPTSPSSVSPSSSYPASPSSASPSSASPSSTSLSSASPSSASPSSASPSPVSPVEAVVPGGFPPGLPSGLPPVLHIPYHLIDIAQPGTKYSVFHFQRDFLRAYNDICTRARLPILCGGTGLYIESVLRGYELVEVPVNQPLRDELEGKTLAELTAILASYKRLHNTTDVDTARRAIRAIEIEEYYRQSGLSHSSSVPSAEVPPSTSPAACGLVGGLPSAIPSITIGLDIPRDLRRERITARLRRRLQEEHMTDEVQHLLDSGVPAEALLSYGLEYRYITLHLLGQLSFDEMAHQLEIAIHQFAKRQMTYFRGMERRGVNIRWIDATSAPKDVADEIFGIFLASFKEKL